MISLYSAGAKFIKHEVKKSSIGSAKMVERLHNLAEVVEEKNHNAGNWTPTKTRDLV